MRSYQQGVGLIEVLVALMLLAIAVLGFSAMQLTAVKATDESLIRTRAMTVLRGGAEMMRANADGIDAFKTAINSTSTSISNNDTKNLNGTSQTITSASCVAGGSPASCTINQLAVRDALTMKKYAADNGLKVGMVNCPTIRTTTTSTNASGVSSTTTTSSAGQNRQCLIASWGDTDPIMLDTPVSTDTSKDQPCANEDGVYNSGVTCFVMEAY